MLSPFVWFAPLSALDKVQIDIEYLAWCHILLVCQLTYHSLMLYSISENFFKPPQRCV